MAAVLRMDVDVGELSDAPGVAPTRQVQRRRRGRRDGSIPAVSLARSPSWQRGGEVVVGASSSFHGGSREGKKEKKGERWRRLGGGEEGGDG